MWFESTHVHRVHVRTHDKTMMETQFQHLREVSEAWWWKAKTFDRDIDIEGDTMTVNAKNADDPYREYDTLYEQFENDEDLRVVGMKPCGENHMEYVVLSQKQ